MAEGVMVDPRVPPDCLRIDLQKTARREAPIAVQVEGRPARGFQAGEARPSVITATLDGPVPYLDHVVGVYAQVAISDARATITQTAPLLALDASGKVVNGLTLTPTAVLVTVPISQLEDFKELAVRVDWQGQPAPGYSVTGINVDPLTLLVTGSPDLIRNLPGFVQTTPVDISNASQNVLRRVAPVLPSGVTLVDEQTVLVEVVIKPIQVSSTVSRTVELQGLGPGLAGAVSPAAVDVILTGPAAVLNALAPDDVRVVVDVFQLGPGTYTLTPRAVILPEGVKAQTVLPSSVQVIISVAPTPTPFGTGEPTGTPTVTPTPTPRPRPG
jgi:YbbR domain-containing protein